MLQSRLLQLCSRCPLSLSAASFSSILPRDLSAEGQGPCFPLPLFARAGLEGRAPHAALPTRSRTEEEDVSGPTVARALSRALEHVLPSLLSRPSACSLPAVRACVALATAFHLSAAVAAFLPTPERPAFKASALTIARPIIQATRNSGMDSLHMRPFSANCSIFPAFLHIILSFQSTQGWKQPFDRL